MLLLQSLPYHLELLQNDFSWMVKEVYAHGKLCLLEYDVLSLARQTVMQSQVAEQPGHMSQVSMAR